MHRLLRVIAACAVALAAFQVSPAPAAAYTPPPLKVAIVKSQDTIDWLVKYNRTSNYPHVGKEEAMRTWLRNRGWSVVQINETQLNDPEELKKYDVIVLPHVFCMKTPTSMALLRYISGGGAVVSVLASPRIAPGFPVPASNLPIIEKWKWGRVLGSTAWSWGPLSEAYQVRFIDDGFTPVFSAAPAPAYHSMNAKAGDVLAARGYSDEVSGMNILRSPGAGVELSKFYPNNPNARAVANFTIQDAAVTAKYPGTYPAIVASQYGLGRSVYFNFSAGDFSPDYNTALYNRKTSTGVPQGEVVGAWLDAALDWAANDDGKRATIVRDGRTHAVTETYQTGIYAFQYVTSAGNVPTVGTLKWRVYDPKGRLVSKSDRYYTPAVPGLTTKFAKRYAPGVRLMTGKYRVVTAYTYTYPTFGYKHAEQAYPVRGHGEKLATTVYERIR